ncbi:class I SAM-dependent methyltransferase [Stutzerimonas urumqiensis]|uniref:class I SAM-dependent methyltransferase n=1 Tax=Stutzerimonas urumqiensis TaxID=638269 RepID=UPI000EB163FB|nr:class I SAM-dependent methyltransferase [Stutzerimonas urumqiensis]
MLTIVESLAPEFETEAQAWSTRLGLPRVGEKPAFALQVGPQGLRLLDLGEEAPGPIQADFIGGAVAHRRQFGGGAGQMIAKAVGVQPGIRPIVMDATAGLGRDAFVLATLGCSVTLIERNPIVGALLEDGLRRASLEPAVAPITALMTLHLGDAIDTMRNWTSAPPEIVYLDPMFPHRDKSALVKKEMRLFRPFVGDDDDAPELLAAALALATHRVVVKRPRKAPVIDGPTPGYSLEGKSSRYDIYPKRKLMPQGR